MTIEKAADKLMATYARFGVDRCEIVRLMRNGIENYNLGVGAVFNGVRMMLGRQLGVQEVFSAKDVAEMLGIGEAEAVLEIEKTKMQLLEQGEDLSKYIISDPQHQKFILKPQKWTS
ncbi:MAG: hypothetical protein V8Q83_01220 [Blautia sp.]